MIKPEIIAGLRNALEHSSSIDEAKLSFINAGYSSIDVNDSANAVNSNMTQQTETLSLPAVQQLNQQNKDVNAISEQKKSVQQVSSQSPQQIQPQIILPQPATTPKPLSNFQTQVEAIEKSSSTRNIILLSVVLVLLLSALVATIFFKDSVNSFLQGLF